MFKNPFVLIGAVIGIILLGFVLYSLFEKVM